MIITIRKNYMKRAHLHSNNPKWFKMTFKQIRVGKSTILAAKSSTKVKDTILDRKKKDFFNWEEGYDKEEEREIREELKTKTRRKRVNI